MILNFISLVILNLLIIYYIKKISKIANIFDIPDKKLKLHKKKVPIIGGLILIINFSIIFFYQIVFLNNFFIFEINSFDNLELGSILFIIYSYFFLGLYDDKYNLNPLKKILFSVLIILITLLLNKNLIISNFSISFYESRIFLENSSIVFTVFCILILINSLNFYDGINGQSCIIFLIFFNYLFFKSDLNIFYLLCIFLILIVTYLNFRNLLFLGDSGIFVLGTILSISLIYEYNFQRNIIFADEIFFLLLLPGFDLIRLTITRALNSKNPLLGDRKHIHHLLIKRYSLLFSNSILVFLSILPVVLFIFLKFNFFLTFFSFLIIYIFLIQFLKVGDKD